jgi:hypothetical protein
MNYKTKKILNNIIGWGLIAILFIVIFGGSILIGKRNNVEYDTLEKAKVECYQNGGNKVEKVSGHSADWKSPTCKLEFVCMRANRSAYTFMIDCVK